MESRFTDLEIRITHQEAAIDEITEALLAQQRLVDQLQRQVEALRGRLRDVEQRDDRDTTDGPEPPPPHY